MMNSSECHTFWQVTPLGHLYLYLVRLMEESWGVSKKGTTWKSGIKLIKGFPRNRKKIRESKKPQHWFQEKEQMVSVKGPAGNLTSLNFRLHFHMENTKRGGLSGLRLKKIIFYLLCLVFVHNIFEHPIVSWPCCTLLRDKPQIAIKHPWTSSLNLPHSSSSLLTVLKMLFFSCQPQEWWHETEAGGGLPPPVGAW